MRIVVNKAQLACPDGLEICVEGHAGNPCEAQPSTSVYIELYEGEVLVHVWNGEEDAVTTRLLTVEEAKIAYSGEGLI